MKCNRKKGLRVAILTLPLNVNYGGLLQAYALSKVLHSLNCITTVVNRRRPYITQKEKVLFIIKNIIIKFIFQKDIKKIVPYFPSKEDYEIITHYTNKFIKKYIPKSEDIFSTEQLKQFCLGNIDGYIVGSDQVWRPCYSPCISNYFLNFIPEDLNVKKISYAASFGVEHWEYSAEQTSTCKRLAKNFDAISVREDSAVRLCKNYFEVNVEHVLDPTMLLTAEDYISLIEEGKVSIGTLFAYLLDTNREKKILLEKVEKKLGLKVFNIKAKTINRQSRKNIDECIAPPVEDWLMAFRDAEFIITDSFHGCIFSIIFNKPFLAIGNEQRGLARFKSLLSISGLERRLISHIKDLTDEKIVESIDWNRVNSLIEKERQKSLNFLKTNLFQGYSDKRPFSSPNQEACSS